MIEGNTLVESGPRPTIIQRKLRFAVLFGNEANGFQGTQKGKADKYHAAIAMSTSVAPDWVPVVLLVTAIVGAPTGIYLFYRGFAVLARKRLIQNIPRSTIRSASIGEVEVTGKAAGPYTILSPLSQTECYFYLTEAHLIGASAQRWVSRKRYLESLSVPFFLEDETGSVMIDARGAEIDLPCTYNKVVSMSTDGHCIRHFLRRRHLPDSGIRLVEYCIADADRLFILGTLAENSSGQNAAFPVTTEPGFLTREAADIQRREVLEFMKVPVPVDYQAEPRGDKEGREFDLSPPVLIRKASTPFVISRYSVREVIQHMKWQSLLYIWGGPVLSLASVAYFLATLARFGKR